MSRGLGRIGRAIAREIEAAHTPSRITGEPCPVQVSTRDILIELHRDPTDWESGYNFTPAQRKAVIRAMHAFVRRYQQYALIGGQGRKQLYLYEADDPLSVMWAKLQVANRKRNAVMPSEARSRLAAQAEADAAAPDLISTAR